MLFRPCCGGPVATELPPVSHEAHLNDAVVLAPCDDEVCDLLADDDNEETSEDSSADVDSSEAVETQTKPSRPILWQVMPLSPGVIQLGPCPIPPAEAMSVTPKR